MTSIAIVYHSGFGTTHQLALYPRYFKMQKYWTPINFSGC